MNEDLENQLTTYIFPIQDETNRLYKEFSLQFSGNGVIHYQSLKKDIQSDKFHLCSFCDNKDSVIKEDYLDAIYKYRTHILQIFKHPKIHLKETREVMPVEIVTRIGYESLHHLASHSEHWERVKATGLVPARLLARTLEDDFAIYENVVSKQLVDRLCKELEKERRRKKKQMLALVTRTALYSMNHQRDMDYKALNLLLKGYMDTQFQALTEKELEKIEDILSKLMLCKESDLYMKLKHAKKITTSLKLTNIFLMDRHYKYIYKLWKTLSHKPEVATENKDTEFMGESNYFSFVYALLMFALKFSEFEIDGNPAQDLIWNDDTVVTQHYTFKKWHCKVEQHKLEHSGLDSVILTMRVDDEYKFDLVEPYSENFDVAKYPYVTIDNSQKIIINRVIMKKEQELLCEALFPEICMKDDNDGKKLNTLAEKKLSGQHKKRKKAGLILKSELSNFFNKRNSRKHTIVLIPLYVLFKDCAEDAQRALDSIYDSVKKDFRGIKIDSFYFLTPFLPMDYENYTHLNADKVRILSHYPSKIWKFGVLPISIEDVNSYKRLIKIFILNKVQLAYINNNINLKEQMKICPICGGELHEGSAGALVCHTCSYKIMRTKCKKCGDYFIYTSYENAILDECYLSPDQSGIYIDSSIMAEKMRALEINHQFKNIIDIDLEKSKINGESVIICPHCGQVNQ